MAVPAFPFWTPRGTPGKRSPGTPESLSALDGEKLNGFWDKFVADRVAEREITRKLFVLPGREGEPLYYIFSDIYLM
jgi:hypothetical protein